jgi:hypothetical protein
MSSTTATTVRARFEGAQLKGTPLDGDVQGHRPLRLVGRLPRESRRLPFALLIVFLVAAGLVGLLLVNTSMQAGAFEAGRLQQTNQLLAEQQGDLQRQVQQLSSPSEVTRRAGELGMVPDPDPGFLRLSDAKVLGDPKPAVRPKAEKPATTKKSATKKPATTKKPAVTKKPATTKKSVGTKKSATTKKPAMSGGTR